MTERSVAAFTGLQRFFFARFGKIERSFVVGIRG